MNKKGTVFIVIGASGSGKTTVFSKIKERLQDDIYIPVYDTARPMRNGEIEGKDYNFISQDRFNEKLDTKSYLATYQCHNFNYGISNEIEREIENGKDVLVGISRKLIKTFKDKFENVKVIFLYVEYEEIINRINLRNREKDHKEIQLRLKNAKDKIEWSKTSKDVDIVIKNIDLEKTINEIVDYMKGI